MNLRAFRLRELRLDGPGMLFASRHVLWYNFLDRKQAEPAYFFLAVFVA